MQNSTTQPFTLLSGPTCWHYTVAAMKLILISILYKVFRITLTWRLNYLGKLSCVYFAVIVTDTPVHVMLWSSDSMQITRYISQSLRVHISIQFSWKATVSTRSLHQFTKHSPRAGVPAPSCVDSVVWSTWGWSRYNCVLPTRLAEPKGKSNTCERGLSLPSTGTNQLIYLSLLRCSLWTFTHLTLRARHIFFIFI